jgi:general stress protein 26
MIETELNYDELKQRMISELEKHRFVVLATTDGKNVTARSMILVSKGLRIFFMTNLNYRKYKQIMVNPNVAIVAGPLQIEGNASLKGHPLDEKNYEYRGAYLERNPEGYERATRVNFPRPDVRVIEVAPTKITMYTPTDTKTGREPYLEILNVAKQKANRVSRSAAKAAFAYLE